MNRLTYYIAVCTIYLVLIAVMITGIVFTDLLLHIIASIVIALSIGQGYTKLPSKPLTYGIVTFLGMRTSIYLREGINFVPILLGFGLELVEIRNELVVVETDVPIWDGPSMYNVVAKVEARLRPCELKTFVDNGEYSGLQEAARIPIELVTDYECSGRSIDKLQKNTSVVSEWIALDLTEGGVPDNPHDDMKGTGTEIKQLSVQFVLPKNVNDARQRAAMTKSQVEAFELQEDYLIKLAQKRFAKMKAAGDVQVRFSEVFKEVAAQLRVAAGQAQEVQSSGRGTIISTTEGGKK